jgi:hypothetical protein
MKFIKIIMLAILIGCFGASCATQSEMKSGNDQEKYYNKHRSRPPAWGGGN